MASYDNVTAKNTYDLWPREDDEHQNVVYQNYQEICNNPQEINDRLIDKPSDYELPQNFGKNVVSKKSHYELNVRVRRGVRTSVIIASIALILAFLASLAAIVSLYFGTHGTSHKDSLQEISILDQNFQAIQAEINNTRNYAMIRQLDNLKKDIAILKAKINNSINENLNLRSQVNLNNEQNSTQDSIITALLAWIPRSVGSRWNPVRSCSDVRPGRSSGNYWVQVNGTRDAVQVYCDTNRTNCSCNTTGGWIRVANLDMTDPDQQCPEGLRLMNRTSPPLRTCGRIGPAGCVSTFFRTHGVKYSRVCGRIKAYQNGVPDGLHPSLNRLDVTIDNTYADGISLSHGQSPRQHIWTFAAADDKLQIYTVCPCTIDPVITETIPSFIEGDYFCDTGSKGPWRIRFYPEYPLWDGEGCDGSSNPCCDFNNPPWFCKQLPQPTADDIELRMCGNQHISDEDTPIEQVEIYAQ